MKITKYGQSAILIEGYKNKRILIDPGSFLFDKIAPESLGKIDIILITHSHSDHFMPGSIKKISEYNHDIKIFSTGEVKEKLSQLNVNCETLSPEQSVTIDNIGIKCIKQVHGDLPNNYPKPENIGFLIDNKIYHPGDASYQKEKPKTEILFVPICGTVVMNPKEAAQFSKEVQAKLIVPIHYDNPKFPVNVNDFVKQAKGLNVHVLGFGESIILE